MKGGSVTDSPSNVSVPRLVCAVPRPCVDVPLVVYPVALLNGGVCGCVVSLCLDWVRLLLIVPASLSSCPRFFSVCVLPRLLWVGKCGGVCRPAQCVVVSWGCAVACVALLLWCAVRYCGVVLWWCVL